MNSILVYDDMKQMGVFAVMDTELTGSTMVYGFNSTYFYAYKFARHCAADDDFCYSVVCLDDACEIHDNLIFFSRSRPHFLVFR